MTLAPISLDTATLPQLLLVDAKLHLRVDSDFDDALIVDLTSRAIAQVEAYFDVHINPSEWAWAPASTDFDVNGLAHCPITPINSFTATMPDPTDPEAPSLDVAADYEFVTDYAVGAIRYKLFGGWQSGLIVGIVSGYADALLLPADLRAEIFETLTRMYEYRNVVVQGGLALMPGWQNLRFGPWWNPKA